ncbi:IS5 family transposase [Streptomyces sparsogenes]|uniref:IS5 family transposase n=1 Tax=Streptomyces sparsogenes TaxID=67365 RepID=UPI003F4CC246
MVGRGELTDAAWERIAPLLPRVDGRAALAGSPAADELEDPPHQAPGQALGRSRGGLTTKVHLAVDGRGLPLAIVITPGNVNDSTVFDTVLEAVRVPRLTVGRPRRRPTTVIADKAYSSRAIQSGLRRRGIRAVIPERADQAAGRRRRGSAGGRPPTFDSEQYKARNVVERCFNRLKQLRAVATRFDKLAARYLAGPRIASLVLWLREQ